MAGWPDGTELVVVYATSEMRLASIFWGDVLVARGGAQLFQVGDEAVWCQWIDESSLRPETIWYRDSLGGVSGPAIAVRCLRPLRGDDDEPAAEPEEIEDVQTESV